jgi:uncharacterized protein YbbC (DUF1343 family)
MRYTLFILIVTLVAGVCRSQETADYRVRPGVEVLRESGFEALKGKRVGLITNPTGIDNS